jgi:hypothetical protein
MGHRLGTRSRLSAICKLQQLFGTAEQFARALVVVQRTLLKTIARICDATTTLDP